MSFHWAKQSVPAVVYRKARLSRSSAAGPIRFKHQWQTIRDARANDTPELSVSDSAQFELPLSTQSRHWLAAGFLNEQNGWTKVNYQSLRRVAANVAISGG